MKKFSKELFLQTVELEKEKGIITQQDIDNALAVWVDDAEGRTKEELKDMFIEIKSLKQDWFEGELEEGEEEIVPVKEEILPLIENKLSKEEYKDEYFEEVKSVDSNLEIIEGIPVDETPLEEILNIKKDILVEKSVSEEKEEEIMVEEKKITKDNSLIKEEEIEN